MQRMNPLDWLLAIVLAYSVIRAAWRGFVREAFALAGLIVGFLLACWSYEAAAKKVAGLISSPPLAQFLCFLAIVIGVMLVAGLLGHIIRRTASAVGLGIFDSLLGALFGLVRGAVLAGAFLLAITAFLPTAAWVQQSTLAPYFLRGAHAVSFAMPPELRLRVRAGIEHLKHKNADWIKLDLPSHNGTSFR